MRISDKSMVLLTVLIFAASFATSVTSQEAENEIGNASIEIKEARNDGVPVQRLEDLLTEANNTYRARKNLDSPSFERVVELTERIKSLRKTAERAHDEIDVLQMEIDEAKQQGINVSEAERFLDLANESLQAGRYDESLDNVENSYSALSEAKAVSVRLQTFYEQEADDFLNYIERNTKKIAAIFLIFSGSVFLIYRELRVFYLRKRKSKLEKKIDSVRQLMKDLEEDYYERQNIPKRAFEIRKDKFRDIMTDAENKVPELEERIKESRTFQSFFT